METFHNSSFGVGTVLDGYAKEKQILISHEMPHRNTYIV